MIMVMVGVIQNNGISGSQLTANQEAKVVYTTQVGTTCNLIQSHGISGSQLAGNLEAKVVIPPRWAQPAIRSRIMVLVEASSQVPWKPKWFVPPRWAQPAIRSRVMVLVGPRRLL